MAKSTMNPMLVSRVLLVVVVAALQMQAFAQSVVTPSNPTAEQMIEQLKSPRTRSLRNLTVEATSPVGAAASSPSSSVATSVTASTGLPSTSTDEQRATTTSTASLANSSIQQESSLEKAELSLQIQFDFNSSKISAESQKLLGNLAIALQSQSLLSSKFAVEGHTDAKGSSAYNLKLSKERANAVVSYLAFMGVSSQRLQASGKGSTHPANPSDPNASENRRVRIVNLD
jgi:outer membrane protein OmpA-like peptidoglycan-associated protein